MKVMSLNFLTFDLNLLRLFDAVMRERNLTRAAEQLAVTQPAASNALRRLRDALGDELFVRAPRGLEPTPYAISIWPAISRALEQLRDALAPSVFEPAAALRTFVVAMADATATLLMPPLVRRLEREAPGISLRILPLTTRDPRRFLQTEDIDVAVGFFPQAIRAVTLHAMNEDTPGPFGLQRVYTSDYVCVMRPGHPLAQLPLTLDAFCAADHLLVSFSGRPFGFIDEALAALGRTRRVVATVNQFFVAGQVVENSDLLTTLPEHFIASTGLADTLAIRRLPMATPPVHVDMLWDAHAAARHGHEWLRQALLDAAREGFAANASTRSSEETTGDLFDASREERAGRS